MLLPIAYCLLPVACCLLPIAKFLLPVACCLLPTANTCGSVPQVHIHTQCQMSTMVLHLVQMNILLRLITITCDRM